MQLRLTYHEQNEPHRVQCENVPPQDKRRWEHITRNVNTNLDRMVQSVCTQDSNR